MDRNWDDLVAQAKAWGVDLPYATMTKAQYSRKALVTLLGQKYITDHGIDLSKEHGLRMRLSIESPMVCANYKDLKPKEIPTVKSPDWVAELKFDGDRMVMTYHPEEGFRFFSRNISVESFLPVEYTSKIVMWTPDGKPSMGRDWANFYKKAFMIDNEILATTKDVNTAIYRKAGVEVGTELNAVNAILAMNDKDSIDLQLTQCKLKFMCFDVLRLGEDRVQDKILRLRRPILEALVNQLSRSHNMELSKWFTGDFKAIFAQVVADGGEGLVLKNLNKAYLATDQRRRDVQLKMKRSHSKTSGEDIDAYVIGFVDATEGKAWAQEGLIGALKLAVRLRKANGTEDEHWVATVGSIPLELRREMSVAGATGPELKKEFYGKVVTIDGQDTSAKARRFMHATIDWARGFRPDKSANECVMDEEYLNSQIL